MWVDRVVILFRVFLKDVDWISYKNLWKIAVEFELYKEEEEDDFLWELEYNEDEGRLLHKQKDGKWYFKLDWEHP